MITGGVSTLSIVPEPSNNSSGRVYFLVWSIRQWMGCSMFGWHAWGSTNLRNRIQVASPTSWIVEEEEATAAATSSFFAKCESSISQQQKLWVNWKFCARCCCNIDSFPVVAPLHEPSIFESQTTTTTTTTHISAFSFSVLGVGHFEGGAMFCSDVLKYTVLNTSPTCNIGGACMSNIFILLEVCCDACMSIFNFCRFASKTCRVCVVCVCSSSHLFCWHKEEYE